MKRLPFYDDTNRKTECRGLRKSENRLYAMFVCTNLYALARAGRNLSPAW